METEKSLLTQVPPPSTLRYVFFGTSAFAALYVFNCLMSLVDYWNAKYPKGTFDLALLMTNIGGLVGFLSARKLSQIFTPGTLIMWGSPTSFLGSALILLVGETVPLSVGWPKKVLGSLGALIVGAAGSVTQTSITSYSFRFGPQEIAAMNSGIAISGIVTVLIEMANIKFSPDSLTTQVMSYELFQLVGVVVIFSITKAYYNSVKGDPFLFFPLNSDSPDSIADAQAAGATIPGSQLSQSVSKLQDSENVTIWSTFKLIYPFWFSIFLVYCLTMSLVPGMVFGMGLGWDDPQANQVILLVFNTIDLLGRYLFSLWVIQSGGFNLSLSLARFGMNVFAALVLMPSGFKQYTGDWPITLTIAALTGLTTGYLNCSLFHLASECTKGKHSVNSAFLMVLGIMLGLAYGSFVNVFGLSS